MKTSIFHLLSLFLIVGFATSCGKSLINGGAQTSPYSNPEAVKVQNQLKTWYASAAENQNIGYRGDFLTISSSATSGFQLSLNLCLGGLVSIGDCAPQVPSGCYLKNNVTNKYTVGTPIISGSVSTGCNVTGAVYSKSTNTTLKKAVNGDGLVLLNASRTGLVFYLYYGPQGSYQPTTMYIVDTAMHSLLNPVVVYENNEKTELKNFSIRQY